MMLLKTADISDDRLRGVYFVILRRPSQPRCFGWIVNFAIKTLSDERRLGNGFGQDFRTAITLGAATNLRS